MVRRPLAVVMVLATLFGIARTLHAQPETEVQADEVTPPRLSYAEGAVSFWRPGGADWAPAQSNTPIAPGDELYTGHDGNLELQLGARAFVRGWGDTQLGLVNQEAGLVQLRVGAGHVALDLRALDAGTAIEVDTPGAAFTIDQPGYYRVDVSPEQTSFVTRRSGQVTITTASGPAGVVQAGDAVLIEDGNVRRVAAPEQDVWDRWNDARTAALVTTASARYVPAQVYGLNELDRYGAWRAEPEYGPVWVPTGVPVGWVPYSTGRWVWDPRFGWTWIDTAPWGWAPYHYGRWVHVRGFWAWAPGPVVVRPVYAPALVAFFGVPGVSITVAGPSVGWVALGWGEPVVPWWGRPGFVGHTWWAGWGGPRVHNVTVHRNVTVVNAVVVVQSDQFGRRPVREARVARPDLSRLEPVRGHLSVKPEPVSFTPSTGPARVRPPETALARPVVSTRPTPSRPEPPRGSDEKHDAKRTPPAARTDVRQGVKEDARPVTRPDAKEDTRPGVRPDARPEIRTPGSQHPAPKATPPTSALPPQKPAPRTVTPPAPPHPPTAAQPPATAPGMSGARPGEVPRGEPRPEGRRPEQARPEQRRQPPRGEPEQAEPQRPDQRRPDGPRSESPRAEPPRRADAPRVEPPRRAAAHGEDARRPEPPRVAPADRRATPGHRANPERPDAPVEPQRHGR